MSESITEDKGGGSETKEELEEPELELQVPSRPESLEASPERNVPTSPASESVASDLHSIKSPDFDERELEDIQLNDRSEDQEENERYSPLPRFNFNSGENSSPKDQEENYESLPTPTTESPEKERPNDEKVEFEQKQTEQKTTPNAVDSLPSQLERTTVLHNSEESAEDTFKRLIQGLKESTLSHKDIVDGLFNVLVGGPFDLESRFIIEHSSNIEKMLDLIAVAPPSIQAEIWSVFVAIVRKSFRNLEACSRVGLISTCLDLLPEADPVISDLLIQLLSVLTNYSITVKETKHFLRALRASNNVWHRNSAKLLTVMQEMPKRDGADVFFSFPGKAGAGISLPPITKWPYQNGWTFSTWLRMDPLNSVNFEKERPYLFNFMTSKGVGYQCYFMGSCLVLNCIRGPGKEVTKCIKQELTPRKWHHIALSFVYSRWAKSEIQCFVDGQLAETIDATWYCSTNDYFDKCFIGCGPEADPNQAFCGQIGAIYVFSQSITAQQANCLYCLGAAYQSYFKHDAESDLPESYKKHLFDSRLNSSLVLAYCPKNCHGQLCIFPTLKTANSFFVQVPHAIMKDGVEVVITHSIHNSLHSVGGIQMLLPLFAQIDMPHNGRDPPVDHEICSSLLSVIALLLRTSPSAQQQLFHSQGFLIIAHVLTKASREHLTLNVLEAFIDISKYLLNCSTGIPLLKQLFDHVLFNPALWIRTESNIQLRLYSYLANEFFSNTNFLVIVRRTSTVIELMYALKIYYYTVPPKPPSTYTVRNIDDHDKVDQQSIVQIRANILQLVNNLMFLKPVNQDEKDINRDDEFQCVFNFIGTVNEDDNLYDVLTQVMHQIGDHPAVMIPAFDRKKGASVIFKLLGSPNELIRIPALKIFGYFICRSTTKRKNETIHAKNLLSLLSDRLLSNAKSITLATYNVLFEILVEQMTPDILFVKHEDPPLDVTRFENSTLLKVIANLLTQSEHSSDLLRVKKIFLEDVIRYCKDSRENRRIILQMSVWQEWLISLAYVFPENKEEEEITTLVYELFAILLFHAIRLEYGGWRVWVDTLAIVHSKVSWEKYRRSLNKNQEKKKTEENDENSEERENADQETPSSLYRTPEFVWSQMHVRLLSDLLGAIEGVVEEWNESSIAVVDHVSNGDNATFISNTVHILSQLTDSLIMACGGLLPLLASATSPHSELEITDSTQQALSIEDAVSFLTRFVQLADVFIFVSGISFAELEHEKNMPNGGILRQALRLVSTMAVRNILAFDPNSVKSSPVTSSNSAFGESPELANGGNGTSEPSPEHTQVTYIDKPKTNGEKKAEVADIPEESLDEEDEEDEQQPAVSSIQFTEESPQESTTDAKYDAEELNRFNAVPTMPKIKTDSEYLTKKLQTAMESVAPLLREIIADFKSFLQKTLLGTHGQEIMNDTKVLQTLRNQQGSVIELVMLLCSQEWQTSLQRHAGLAFIELVNEGRLMAHATRDHVLRVANEADFILNRLRAEDVSKHTSFDHESLNQLQTRYQEDQVSDHLILSSRRRDQLTASKSLEKMRTILLSPNGAWCTNDEDGQTFWKLDLWEDDSRRRKRFVPNVYGCKHSTASVSNKQLTQEEIEETEKAQEQLLKDLTHKMIISQSKNSAAIHDLVDESDIENWSTEDNENRDSRQERTSYSTPGKLIAPGIVVPGTISITSSDVYFDADEDDPVYKQQDSKVG
ncbi:hypothetical protein FO519_002135 [Halicephalobus sp. NKZ332]|nr:hypothetical protein FO519_002135 [Halicephalobus sp. NKZ332]